MPCNVVHGQSALGVHWFLKSRKLQSRITRMKLRVIWAIFAANLVAAILLSLAGFLTVRYAPWGHLAIDASKMSPQGLAVKYGDAEALLHRGLFVDLWITGPIIAILTGLTSGAFYRRADWRVSSLGTAVLIIFTVSTMNV